MLTFSPALKYNVRYNAAKSTCRRWMVVLPKIVVNKDGTGYCACRSLWSTEATNVFSFFLNQTLVTVRVPGEYQIDDHILTPVGGAEDIILPILRIDIKHDWRPPIFKDLDDLKRLASANEMEKLHQKWER